VANLPTKDLPDFTSITTGNNNSLEVLIAAAARRRSIVKIVAILTERIKTYGLLSARATAEYEHIEQMFSTAH